MENMGAGENIPSLNIDIPEKIGKFWINKIK